MNNSYFECKRCFYRCNQKSDMQRHINKKILCTRIIESYKYDIEKLRELSLIRIYDNEYESDDKSNHICFRCNKSFISNSSLKRHNMNYCKSKSEEDKKCNKANICESKKINIENLNNNIDNSNTTINNTTINNTTINNTINNNVNFNINITKSFDEDWDISNIDLNKKLILLLNNSKFTSTLENILENEVNLNVLIDKTSDTGLVYLDNSFKKMAIKDIVKKAMEKLYKQLCIFHNDIIEPNVLNINTNIIADELNVAKNKYYQYRVDKEIQNSVNKLMSDIYVKKQDNTVKVLQNNAEGY